MAHCPYEKLKDIESVLEEIRKLDGIKEPKPGIFYFKSKGFLHFHIDKDNNRWADIRDGKDWGKPVKFQIGDALLAKKKFLSTVKKRFAHCKKY